MRLLVIYHLSPYPPKYGGAKRNFHLLEQLAKHHRLTVISNGSEEEEQGFRRYFEKQVERIVFISNVLPRWARGVRYLLNMMLGRSRARLFLSQAMQEAVDEALSTTDFDAVLCSLLHLGYLRFPSGMPLIGNTQNVEYDNAYRAFREATGRLKKFSYFLEYKALRREELHIARRFRVILPTSQRDRDLFAQNLAGLPMIVIENGVDMEYFSPRNVLPEKNTVVFTGAMNYYPNEHAVGFFMDSVWPLITRRLPDARLFVVGTNPSGHILRYASENVIITGYVDDVRDYMARAGVFIMPLFIGGGTRIKALEAMAMKKPIVSTTIGCEGLPVKDGESILIADSAKDFAAAVIRVLEDPALAGRLGKAGFALVRHGYRWESIGEKLDAALKTAIGPYPPVRLHTEAPGAPEPPVLPPARKMPPVRVLLYHRVAADDAPEDDFCISQGTLARQLEFLERMGYTAVTFEDVRLFKEGKINLPRKPIIITFDDGYGGVHDYALAVMREMGMPGVVFVVGDRSIRTNVWDTDRGMTGVPLLDDHQVLELDREGFEIGSHSMTHRALPEIAHEKAWEEIQNSRCQLEILLNKPVRSFSYPFGLVSADVKRMVSEAGYQTACAAWTGPVALDKDPLEVRRILVRGSLGLRGLAFQMLTPYQQYRWGWWKLKETFSSERGLRT